MRENWKTFLYWKFFLVFIFILLHFCCCMKFSSTPPPLFCIFQWNNFHFVSPQKFSIPSSAEDHFSNKENPLTFNNKNVWFLIKNFFILLLLCCCVVVVAAAAAAVVASHNFQFGINLHHKTSHFWTLNCRNYWLK